MQLQPLFKQSKICMSVSSNTLFFCSFFCVGDECTRGKEEWSVLMLQWSGK